MFLADLVSGATPCPMTVVDAAVANGAKLLSGSIVTALPVIGNGFVSLEDAGVEVVRNSTFVGTGAVVGRWLGANRKISTSCGASLAPVFANPAWADVSPMNCFWPMRLRLQLYRKTTIPSWQDHRDHPTMYESCLGGVGPTGFDLFVCWPGVVYTELSVMTSQCLDALYRDKCFSRDMKCPDACLQVESIASVAPRPGFSLGAGQSLSRTVLSG